MKWGLMLVAGLACWGLAEPLMALPEVTVLAVGSNESFRDSLPNLLYAEDDAERFVRAMKTVGLVPEARATTLNGPSVNEFRQILTSLSLPSGLGLSDDSRKFIFYYSGHADETGLHLHDGLISKKELHEALSHIGAHTKVAIIDSCFSGSLTAKGVEPAPAFELPKVEFDEPSGSVFLSSAAGRQFSYESDKLESSIFTHHLVAGLYGEADGNVDGVVTVDELYQYVYRNTRWQSLNLPIKETQKPEIYASLQGQGAVVLSFPSQTNSRLALEKAVDGEVTIASAKGLQYFRVQKRAGEEKVLQLPAGRYKVSVRKGDSTGRGEVELRPTKMAFLSEDDFDWQQAKAETAHAKGIEVLSIEPLPSQPSPFKHWTADFGGHEGFVEENREAGPYFMGSYRFPIGGRGFFTFAGFIGASFHRNQYPSIMDDDSSTEFSVTASDSDIRIESDDDDPHYTSDSSALWVGIWPEFDLASLGFHPRVKFLPQLLFDFRLAYGQTYHHQKWASDHVNGGAAPGFHSSFGVVYRLKSGLGIGLRTSRDTVESDDVSGIQETHGDSVSLTLHY